MNVTITGPLRPFLLFAGDTYYPSGGWGDYKGSFPSYELAREAARPHDNRGDWWHIVDLTKGHMTDGGA
jgi:hypothetical protein